LLINAKTLIKSLRNSDEMPNAETILAVTAGYGNSAGYENLAGFSSFSSFGVLAFWQFQH
jgi:hypothetical protein